MKNIIVAFCAFFVTSVYGQSFVNGITTLGTDTIETMPIIKGDTVEAVFYIANKGVLSFPIWQVHPGCQCTAPQYPKDSIAPGQVDSIVLMFYSKKTDELEFEKYAIVLTPLGEKTYIIRGRMSIPDETKKYIPKRYRITNNILRP